jgi:ribosome-associated protein
MEQLTERPLKGRPLPDADLEMDEVLRLIVQALDEKKAERVTALDVSDIVDYIDYLIIASGQTDVHNRALADHVEAVLSRYDIIPDGISGYRSGGWVVLDYGILAVHLFTPAMRDFYRLDELWEAGSLIDVGLK